MSSLYAKPRFSVKALTAAIALSTFTLPAFAEDVEVLHWWTSGGEAKALQILKADLEKQGYGWQDLAIAGGGGDNAKTTLRARVLSGEPPTAVQMLGFSIQEWAEQGTLANLNELAAKNDWDRLVPPDLQRFSKYDGKWVSVPVNIHRTNWIWANKKIFDDLDLAVPTTFDELLAISDIIRKAGYIPLAHGGQAWQEATIFDSVVMSVGGPEFYQKAFVDLDLDALSSPTMVKVFDQMKAVRGLVDDNFSGRDWNIATAMVIRGDAAMQIMGDWAKGEFINAGKLPNKDFLCFEYPGTSGTFIYNSDQFAMFEVEDARKKAQLAMAQSVMDENFQEKFNIVKGSIPANLAVSPTNFDACGQKSMADLKDAVKKGTMFGSIAHGHANQAAIQGAIVDAVTDHFNSSASSETAAKTLVSLVQGAM
ncbi:ABC transporter substrate-binding protein [Marinomonas communis]|uniref:Probable sugar-binding periplasmic protein n=1 Tax=Marinomonas communis TaxID=28254 RepID=A0A4R6X2V6_9GAMM|nr:ABC transporter substrate-binding protein [Marinomonas communis]TDR05886.1 carbohydrate ABC transporter substrate-binding protein (CUT1 family) [Marinomonas communis]